MGLDVSLKHCADMDTALANQKHCEEYSDRVWEEAGDYKTLTEESKQSIRHQTKAYNEAFNCDDWGSSNDIADVCFKSTIHPDHMFEVGYLRSSYNEGGINNVLRRLDCMDLYGIFNVTDNHDYYVKPNWDDSLGRVNQVIADVKLHMEGPMAMYDAIHLRGFGDGVPDAATALKLLEKELEDNQNRGPAFGNSYSNRDGDWFLDGIEIVGAVKASSFGGGTFLLTKSKESNLAWYYQALEVTREMIEYVLSQPDPENYVLGWSA